MTKQQVQVNRDVLVQVLEALERYQVKRQDFERFADEITALRAALEQPEQEEIADLRQACREGWRYADELEQERERLTAALAALEQPVQEPVAWAVVGDGKFGEYKLGKNFETSDPPNFKYWKNRGYELAPLYTAPPQTTHWQGCEEVHPECAAKSWAELEQKYQSGCTHCTHPQYAGIRCNVCGRWTDK
jgi:hypothetical protein